MEYLVKYSFYRNLNKRLRALKLALGIFVMLLLKIILPIVISLIYLLYMIIITPFFYIARFLKTWLQNNLWFSQNCGHRD